jgi:hypothetical protein
MMSPETVAKQDSVKSMLSQKASPLSELRSYIPDTAPTLR